LSSSASWICTRAASTSSPSSASAPKRSPPSRAPASWKGWPRWSKSAIGSRFTPRRREEERLTPQHRQSFSLKGRRALLLQRGSFLQTPPKATLLPLREKVGFRLKSERSDEGCAVLASQNFTPAAKLPANPRSACPPA